MSDIKASRAELQQRHPLNSRRTIRRAQLGSPSRIQRLLGKFSEKVRKAVMGRPAKYFYEFGPFRLAPAEHRLLRAGESVWLTPKVFDILLVLVENSGHVLGKDELMKAVWPESFVEEGNLTRNVSTLRTSLGDSTDGYQYIETVPKVGYRFTAGVKKVGEIPDQFVEERFGSHAAAEEEAPGVQDQDEQDFDENGSGAASGFRVLRSEDASRTDYAALENQAAPVTARAGSLLSWSRKKMI